MADPPLRLCPGRHTPAAASHETAGEALRTEAAGVRAGAVPEVGTSGRGGGGTFDIEDVGRAGGGGGFLRTSSWRCGKGAGEEGGDGRDTRDLRGAVDEVGKRMFVLEGTCL